jgi:hypothetical protein
MVRRQGDAHQAVAAGLVDAAHGELLEHEALALVEDFLAGLVGIDLADRDRAGLQAGNREVGRVLEPVALAEPVPDAAVEVGEVADDAGDLWAAIIWLQ